MVDVNIIRMLVEDVLSQYPLETTPGLDAAIIKDTVMPALMQQYASLETMPHEQQIAVLLASVGKLSLDAFALNYKLAKATYK